MIIDKNGNLFGKINIIDLFVLVVLILAAVFLWYKFTGLNNTKSGAVEKTYTVLVSGIKEDSAKYLKKGEKLYDDKNAYMGEIADIKLRPSESIRTLENGQYKVSENPERVDAVLTVHGVGFTSGGIFYLDGKNSLLVGTERFFKGDRVDFEGKILSINN